jgi:hypothetical protein
VNLAGVEIVLKMRKRMLEMQRQLEEVLAYVRQEAASGNHARSDAGEALVRAASGQLQGLDFF